MDGQQADTEFIGQGETIINRTILAVPRVVGDDTGIVEIAEIKSRNIKRYIAQRLQEQLSLYLSAKGVLSLNPDSCASLVSVHPSMPA